MSGAKLDLSADGMTVASAAYAHDGSTGANSGHASVFTYNNEKREWEQLGQDIEGEAAGDEFGTSIAISADGMIVAAGAYLNEENGRRAGHVRVYEYSNSSKMWEQLGQDMDGETAWVRFGQRVALSSDGMIMASAGPTHSGIAEDAGVVRVFTYDSDAQEWTQLGKDILGQYEEGRFGIGLALSADGMIVAAGAPDRNGDRSGHIRIFGFENPQQ